MSYGQSWPDGATRREALELLGGVIVAMAMVPENPVVGGTVLRRAAIQSPNYVPGVSGWIIKQDGSVEFNNGVFRGSIVGGSLFIYNGAPGPGNPPVFSVVPPGTTQDPYGNAVTPVLGAGTAGNQMQVTATGRTNFYAGGLVNMLIDPANQAMLYYLSGAGLGNLDASISPTGGTDDFGQSFLDGIVSYLISVSGLAVRLGSGIISFYHSTGAGHPWVAGANISGDGSGDLILGTIAGQTVIIQDKASITDTVNGANPVLDVTNQGSSITPIIRSTANAVGDLCFGGRVTGDTAARFTVDSVSGGYASRIRLGSGAAAPNTLIAWAAAGLLASSFIAFNNAGSAESLNAVTFANGWANAAGAQALQYKRVAAPDNCILIVGTVTVPVGFAAGQAVTAALPAAYRPSALIAELPGQNLQTGNNARLTLASNGVINYQSGGNVAGNNIAIPATLVSLDA